MYQALLVKEISIYSCFFPVCSVTTKKSQGRKKRKKHFNDKICTVKAPIMK